MLEKYMFPKESIKNVIKDGAAIGFEFKVGIPYYRGVMLSMIDTVWVKYDDTLFTQDQLTFTVGGTTHNFEDMATMTTLRWEFGEMATVFVPLKGGFDLGNHRVEVSIAIRMSYGGRVPRATSAVQFAELTSN
jgi:hypothetical protein